MIRIAIVGCKNMGRKHFNVIKTHFNEQATVVGILNSSKESTEKTASELGVTAFESFDDITKDSVDAVIVATPAENHYSTTLKLLEKRIPTLVEKPFASNIDECNMLRKMAEDNNVPLLVGHTENYNPAVEKMLNMIQRPIKSIKAIRTSCNPGFKDTHIVSELMIHDLAIVNSLMSDAPTKTSICKDSKYRWDEHAIVETEYASGTTVCLEAVRADVAVERNMSIIDNNNDMYEISFYDRKLRRNGQLIPCVGDSLQSEIQDFLNMVQTGARPKVSLEEACKNVEICNRLEILSSESEKTHALGKVMSGARKYNGLG